jgi:hypothetical protein
MSEIVLLIALFLALAGGAQSDQQQQPGKQFTTFKKLPS